MSANGLALDVLFQVLPRTAELAGLRASILAASTRSPVDPWRASAVYATIDNRVATDEALDSVFAAAEARSVAHVRRYHRGLREALRSAAAGHLPAGLGVLQQLGEEAVEGARWEESISYFSAVAHLAETLHAPDALVRAARRLGLAFLHLGQVSSATRWYERALAEARPLGDRQNLASAHIGLGHTFSVQGRWHAAERQYHDALRACQPEDRQLTGQIYVNLSMTARERGHAGEARNWLTAAAELWEALSAADRSVWHNNDGMLLLVHDELALANAAFQRALPLAPSHFDTAMILDNLAEIHLRLGELDDADAVARRAEEYAIASASIRALADIYLRLGRIARQRSDSNGVAFYEKALTLSREYGYALTEANVCLAYADFRAELGDTDEASGLRERARELHALLA